MGINLSVCEKTIYPHPVCAGAAPSVVKHLREASVHGIVKHLREASRFTGPTGPHDATTDDDAEPPVVLRDDANIKPAHASPSRIRAAASTM